MPGTRIGGLKARDKIMARDPGHYKRIAATGGRNGHTGGFAADVDCSCDEIAGPHYKRQCAGKRGGRTSRRGPSRKTDAGFMIADYKPKKGLWARVKEVISE